MHLKKGQASVEYLMVVAIGLVLIGISVGALSLIRDAEEGLSSLEMARVSAGSIKGASDEACALGDGNSRALEFSWETSLECSNDVVKASVGEGSALVALEHCNVYCPGASGSRFLIENEMGSVRISGN
jgi:hypothetical protein